MAIVNFLGRQLEADPLNAGEKAILDRDIFEILATGSSFLKETLEVNRNNIYAAAGVAKRSQQKAFGGILAPDSEVGVSLLRPGHILRDTTTAETPINTWDSNSIESGAFVAGNDYYIGSGSTNSTAAIISQYLTLMLMGVVFTQGNAPIVQELYISVGETTYPVIVLRQSWMADNPNRIRATRFPPILIEPRQTISAQVRAEYTGRQELVLLGLAFGTGRYLRKQSYAAADLP